MYNPGNPQQESYTKAETLLDESPKNLYQQIQKGRCKKFRPDSGTIKTIIF